MGDLIGEECRDFLAYSEACREIELLMPKPKVIPMPIGWNVSRLEDRAA